jgi:putative heme transporter
MILHSEAFAVRLGRGADGLVAHVTRVFHRISSSHLGRTLPGFRTSMVGLLRVCWHKLTLAQVVSQLTACLVLGVACRMQGFDQQSISWAVIVVAWGAVTLASLIIPTPGGLGVAEVVLVTILGYGLPESDQGAVLAAVLLYRIATFLVPIPVGLVTYLYWRQSTAWRRPPNSRRPTAEQRSAATSVD